MTKEQVHDALCKASDEDKMKMAMACQMNGVDIQSIEEAIANVVTGVQENIEPAMEYYRYLGGK